MKPLSIFLSLVLFALALTYWLPMEGSWLDESLSRYFSAKFHTELEVHHAKVTRWRIIDFKSLNISVTPDFPKILSGAGRMELKSFPWPTSGREEAVIVIHQLEVPADLYRKAAIPFLPQAETLGPVLTIDRLKLSISHSAVGTNYHLLEAVSKDFRLQGGMTIADSKVSRVHALLFLPASTLDTLPDSFRTRLIQRSNGWMGLRVLYSRHMLTAIGANGPFFKANWS